MWATPTHPGLSHGCTPPATPPGLSEQMFVNALEELAEHEGQEGAGVHDDRDGSHADGPEAEDITIFAQT